MLINAKPSGIVSMIPPIWSPVMFSIISNVEPGIGVVVEGVRVTTVSVAVALTLTIGASESKSNEIASIATLNVNNIRGIFLLFSLIFLFTMSSSI